MLTVPSLALTAALIAAPLPALADAWIPGQVVPDPGRPGATPTPGVEAAGAGRSTSAAPTASNALPGAPGPIPGGAGPRQLFDTPIGWIPLAERPPVGMAAWSGSQGDLALVVVTPEPDPLDPVDPVAPITPLDPPEPDVPGPAGIAGAAAAWGFSRRLRARCRLRSRS